MWLLLDNETNEIICVGEHVGSQRFPFPEKSMRIIGEHLIFVNVMLGKRYIFSKKREDCNLLFEATTDLHDVIGWDSAPIKCKNPA